MIFFAQNKITDLLKFETELEQLINKKIIFKLGDFYSLEDVPTQENRRKEGNKRAEEFLKIGQKKSKFISKFPYVRGVFISGSLSKNYIDQDGDIDYFIITKPNRLWIARTCLVLYKKVFLLNSRKYFCVNYFIDEDNLEIPEKNLFTATEIVTILPMVGEKLYSKFMNENKWVFDFFPNAKIKEEKNITKPKNKGVWELVLNTKLGDFIDSYFMKLTLKRWQKKFKQFTPEEFNLVLKTNKRTSKHHPSNFQEKVLTNYALKLNEVLAKNDLSN